MCFLHHIEFLKGEISEQTNILACTAGDPVCFFVFCRCERELSSPVPVVVKGEWLLLLDASAEKSQGKITLSAYYTG